MPLKARFSLRWQHFSWPKMGAEKCHAEMCCPTRFWGKSEQQSGIVARNINIEEAKNQRNAPRLHAFNPDDRLVSILRSFPRPKTVRTTHRWSYKYSAKQFWFRTPRDTLAPSSRRAIRRMSASRSSASPEVPANPSNL